MKKTSSIKKTKALQDLKKARDYFKSQLAFSLGPAELRRRMQAGDPVNVFDVRRLAAFSEAHIPGSVNLPREAWAEAKGLDKDKINVLYCSTQQCQLSTEACLYFATKGYPVMHLEGGFDAWTSYGYDVEVAPPSEGQQGEPLEQAA